MNITERTQSKRIQTSLFNAAEKKILVWTAKRLPAWVSSDMLTAFGVFGSIVVAAGYILSNLNFNYLWIANLGLLFNWFGDSLDGSLARVRNTQRPIYGFFLDHNVDGITMTIMCVGAGLSRLINLNLAMAVLVVYLLLSIYVYIGAHLKNEFKLTYGNMGPTEFRAIVFILNVLFMYIAPIRDYCREWRFFGNTVTLTIFDYLVVGIIITLSVIYLNSIVRDAKFYARLDPLPVHKD